MEKLQELLEQIKTMARETEIQEQEATGKAKWKLYGENSAYNHVIALIEEKMK